MKYKISDFLTRSRDIVDVKDDQEYRRVTIRMNHQGVCLRNIEKGVNIGTKKQYSIKEGQFILSGIDARNAAFGLVPKELDGAIVTNDFWAFDINPKLVNMHYFYFLTKTPDFLYACKKASIGTTNRQRLQKDKFYEQSFDIIPIDEQENKVRYIQNITNKILECNQKIVDLTFQNAKLKSSILDEATQGRLVPQDHNDEPAEKLIEKIKIEHNYAQIQDTERLFDIPSNWVWVRLGNIVSIKSSKRIYANEYSKEGIPFYRSKEIGELSRDGKTKNELYINLSRYQEIKNKFGVPKKGDLLLTSVGSIGNTWIVDDRQFYYKDGNITQFVGNNFIYMPYIQIFINSSLFKNQVTDKVSGTAYNALTIIKINNLHFPLPPVNEQKRIVEKVELIMNLCGEQEKYIIETKENINKLNQAILREMFN